MVMTDAALKQIREAVAAVNRAQDKRDRLVRSLRASGGTWTEVGFALGVTAQAAQQKYGSGDERSEAFRERAAQRALAKKRRDARKAGS